VRGEASHQSNSKVFFTYCRILAGRSAFPAGRIPHSAFVRTHPQKYTMQMRKLDFPMLCSVAALLDRTHGLSGNLPLRLNSRSTPTPPLTPTPLDKRSKGTWLYSSKDDNQFVSSRSPIQSIIDTMQSNPAKSIQFSLMMTLSGAALGPFLDSYHSLCGVLTYDTPLVFPILGYIGGDTALLTCVTTYWVSRMPPTTDRTSQFSTPMPTQYFSAKLPRLFQPRYRLYLGWPGF
jgi:hypothetical protein